MRCRSFSAPPFHCGHKTSIEIDLEEQIAYLLQNGRVALASPISSGRYGHLSEKGSFKVLEKERTHYSSMYGKIIDSRGEHHRCGRRCGHADSCRGKIHSGANALLHAVRRRRRNACRISTGLSSVARLCPDAGTVRDCVLQFSHCWYFGHGVRKDANRALPGEITTDISKGP